MFHGGAIVPSLLNNFHIGVVGSRRPFPASITAVKALVSSVPVQSRFVTGCCQGIDQAILHHAKLAGFGVLYLRASSQLPLILRQRTARVVAASSVLFAFPSHTRIPHSGTWLAVNLAVKAGLSVFVHIPPGLRLSNFPVYSIIQGWQQPLQLPLPFQVPGVQFAMPVVSQLSLQV